MANSHDTINIKKDLPMNILVCGINIKKVFIKSLFDDKVKETYKNKGNYDEYSYSLSYTLSPSYTSEFSYSSTGLLSPEDFDWNRMKSTMVVFKLPTTLTSTFGYKGNFLSLTDSFDFNPVYQNHPYLSTDTAHGGYEQSGIDSIKKTDYEARKLDLSNSNAVAIKPFVIMRSPFYLAIIAEKFDDF